MKRTELEKRIVGLEKRVAQLEKRITAFVNTPIYPLKLSIAEELLEETKKESVEWVRLIGKTPTDTIPRPYLIAVTSGVRIAVWDNVDGCFRPNPGTRDRYHDVAYWAELPATPEEAEKL